MMSPLKYIKARWIIHLALILNSVFCFGQGRNFTWLLGHHYGATSFEGRINFTQNNYSILSEQRTIPFLDMQGNISDENGNILISSNGFFIANATGDTMLNGSGINPGQFTDDYGAQGLPILSGNIILPMPDDSSKYVLFHQTANYFSPTLSSTEIYYSIIDISQDGGLGSVISKNNIALNGSFGWGLSACKHGNGRDWWITAISDSGSTAYQILLSPNSVQYVGSQYLQVPSYPAWGGQPKFSPDGEKFAFSHTKNLGNGKYPLDIRLFDFDRCTGIFSNKLYTALGDSAGGFGISFSPNSKYLYVSSFEKIYQFNTDTNNIIATLNTVAVNDTFLSAPPVFYTNFHQMYLAANGIIYLTSTNGVLDLHTINSADSAGLASDVQLHNIHLPCFNVGTVPNHPNYYLGRKIGSSCDSLTSLKEIGIDFKFQIFPNPVVDDNFNIIYLLPKNKNGLLEIYDLTGRKIYNLTLPNWSTFQNVFISKISSGIYHVTLTADNKIVTKKIIILHD